MKIIGETKNGFITELSVDELANLTGYRSNYSSSFIKPKIGDLIEITWLYERITTIEQLLNDGLIDAIDTLNTKVKALNIVKNIFKDITIKQKTL